MAVQSIFRFSAEVCDYKQDPTTKEAKALLGGKGAALVAMAKAGFNVPPGFTITTGVCNTYRALDADGKAKLVDKLMGEVATHMVWLMDEIGYTPLVSVRSGAAVSMPGMMDTILNVGLTNENLDTWAKRIGDRAAFDSQRRLVQMLGSTAYGVPSSVFEFQLAKVKKKFGVKADTDLTCNALLVVVKCCLDAFVANKGFAFPADNAVEQVRAAIVAVFNSWDNPRAIEYRKLNKLSDAMGTAVTVQAMVFGNMGVDSGSGVLFTRDPSTGESAVLGEYLANAQGEDVVAGIRTPIPLATFYKASELDPNEVVATEPWAAELVEVCEKLEGHYRDMVDVEFTVQKGELFILQSRTGKRSARAAFKIAVDLVNEGAIKKAEALTRLTREQFKVVRRPTIDPAFKVDPNLTGIPACPGVVTGRPVFSADEAVKASDPVVLVTHETNPNDIAGMAKAVGILTKTGGATSHAAVVARAMDKACVVGCTDLDIEALKSQAKLGLLTIDGSTGKVWFGVDVPVIDSSEAAEIKVVAAWCLEALCAREATPVVIADGRPQCIDLTRSWGSKEVLKATLGDVAKLKSRAHVSLSLASPRDCAQNGDSALLDCFGPRKSDGFKATIASVLVKNKAKLAGLTLYGADECKPQLVAAGYAVGPEKWPMALPADYAVFSVLA